MKRLVVVLFLAGIAPSPLMADDYQEVVSSFDTDFYKIDSKNILIRTENCYDTVESQQVLAKMKGATGEIIFSESGNTCAVAGVYQTKGYRVGNYRVDITRDAENWYRISGQNMFILTQECLIYATEQEALLSISTVGKGGSGSLHFEHEACRVVGLYSPMSL